MSSEKRIDIEKTVSIFTEQRQNPRLYPVCGSYGHGSGECGGSACLTSGLVAQVDPTVDFEDLNSTEVARILNFDQRYVNGLINGWDRDPFEDSELDSDSFKNGKRDAQAVKSKLADKGIEIQEGIDDDDEEDDDWDDDLDYDDLDDEEDYCDDPDCDLCNGEF